MAPSNDPNAQNGANPVPPRFSTHESTNTAPLPFFHPTRAELHPHEGEGATGESSTWSSRASRKNRFQPGVVSLEHRPGANGDVEKGAAGTSGAAGAAVLVEQRVRHPHTQFKLHLTWDISFWVAVIFTLGSIAWVVNGFYILLPLFPKLKFKTHQDATAWWAFVGGTLFEVGAYLMLVESLNAGHEQLFGPALWALTGSKHSIDSPSGSNEKLNAAGASTPWQGQRFRWLGLNTWRDIGFTASFIQMWAATIFWVSTITGLPGVIKGFPLHPPTAITDVFFWTPQVMGGMGFVIASLLLMLEVQKAWYKPALSSLGWHVGLWNLIGAVGFLLSGAFGYDSLNSSKLEFQSGLSTFWGGWAFLIGSIIQLWETLWREDPGQ